MLTVDLLCQALIAFSVGLLNRAMILLGSWRHVATKVTPGHRRGCYKPLPHLRPFKHLLTSRNLLLYLTLTALSYPKTCLSSLLLMHFKQSLEFFEVAFHKLVQDLSSHRFLQAPRGPPFQPWIPLNATVPTIFTGPPWTTMDHGFRSTLGLKPLPLVFRYNIYRGTGQWMSPWHLQGKNSESVPNSESTK